MKRVVNYRPMTLLALCLMSGIVAAGLCLDSYLARTVILLTLAVAVAVLFICKKGKYSVYVTAVALGLLLLSGACDLYNSRTVAVDNAELSARIVSNVASYGNRYEYEVDRIVVNGEEIYGKADFICDDPNLELGTRVSFFEDLSAEEFNTSWTFLTNYRNKTYYEFSPDAYEIVGTGFGAPLSARVKRAVADNVYSVLRADSGDIIMALLFSEKSDTDANLYADVGATGLAHLFAVSGLHIGFLSVGIIWLLKKLKANAVVRLIVTPVVLFLYALLCGFPASVIRASIMTVIYLIADAIGAKKDSLSALSTAAVICLILQPAELYLAGFQMSFLAVLALIVFVQHGKPWLTRLPKFVGTIVKASVAANTMLFPIIARAFSSIPLLFIPANVLILPIMPFIFIVLLFNVAITTILPFLAPLNYLSGLVVLPVKLLAFIVGSLSVNSVSVSALGWLAVAFYAIIIVCSRFVFLTKRTKAILVAVIATAAALLGIFI